MLMILLFIIAATLIMMMSFDLSPRGNGVGNLKKWGKAMLDALLKMFREPLPPLDQTQRPTPSAETRQAVFSDPDMPGLPGSSRDRVRRINKQIEGITKRIEGRPLGIPLVIEMEQMRDRHLPKLLQSYVEIPETARLEIFNQTQKSASVHLGCALDAMLARLLEIDKGLARENIDAFTDNSRFIERTYGHGGDPLA